MKPLLLAAIASLCMSASAAAQRPDSSARRPLAAELAAARERAEAGAQSVKRIAVTPSRLALSVGDTIVSYDLWSQLHIVGLTAAGDSIRDFAKFLALQPNPYLEQHGSTLIARRPGTAVLWIYIGSNPNRAFFTDAEYAERVRVTIK